MNDRYEIRVRGLLGPLLRFVFADLSSRTLRQQSVIRGRLSPADLERLLQRLDRWGLQVVRLDRLGWADRGRLSFVADGAPAPAGRHDRSADRSNVQP